MFQRLSKAQREAASQLINAFQKAKFSIKMRHDLSLQSVIMLSSTPIVTKIKSLGYFRVTFHKVTGDILRPKMSEHHFRHRALISSLLQIIDILQKDLIMKWNDAKASSAKENVESGPVIIAITFHFSEWKMEVLLSNLSMRPKGFHLSV